MARLTIYSAGAPLEVEFDAPAPVGEVLERAGCAPVRPCGGRGQCGKCAVAVTGKVSEPNAAEQRSGARLSCQSVLLGDAQVYLPQSTHWSRVELGGGEMAAPVQPMPGAYGAAVDIGTTTVALRLFDLSSGRCVGAAGAPNPQMSVSLDVMGRINAAVYGQLAPMHGQIHAAVQALVVCACAEGGIDPRAVESLVVTGNTTMLYFFTKRSPRCLWRAPFEADTLFDTMFALPGRRAYLPPCMSAFVGADITCAVLASGMCRAEETALLCDMGTNGEIALWHGGRLYAASTAAGPAFEGAGISCGCGSVDGAIDRVAWKNGALEIHTIGGGAPAGLCGSGLIDAVAAFLQSEDISPIGRVGGPLSLSGNIALNQKDIRAVQLAKAAIAAGIETVMHRAGVSPEEIGVFYVAGGFGSHLDLANAAAIGLFPAELAGRAKVIGNAAVDGASRLLLDAAAQEQSRAIASRAELIGLSGDSEFSVAFIDHIHFGDPDDF